MLWGSQEFLATRAHGSTISFLYSPFNYTLAISADHLMSHFSRNLPRCPWSKVSHGPGAVSGGQPLISSSPVVVPIPVAIVNPPPDGVGSLIPTPSHGHSINEDPVTSVEPFESTPQMNKGKPPMEEGLQCKNKRVVSIERDKSIPREGLMADARCACREEEFFLLIWVLIRGVGLQMSRIVADNFPSSSSSYPMAKWMPQHGWLEKFEAGQSRASFPLWYDGLLLPGEFPTLLIYFF